MINEETSSFCLEDLSFSEISSKISENPSIILPIGGLEPLGSNMPLGVLNLITENVVSLIAKKSKTLYAPVYNYGNTTGFSAFEGVLGIKRSTFESSLRNMVNDCRKWGIERILIFAMGTISSDLLPVIVKKIKKKHGENIEIDIFDFQNNRDFKNEILGNARSDARMEKSLLSLALYFNKKYDSENIEKYNNKNSDIYSRWNRRGKDPELFRKYFPKSITTSESMDCSTEEGENLLNKLADYCSKLLDRKVSSL